MKNLRKALIFAIISQTLLFCSKETETLDETKSNTQFTENVNRLASADDSNLLLGDPSGANGDDYDNYYLAKTGYTSSYCNKKGIPNWVSWHVDASSFGDAKRANDFRTDNSLPSAFFKASNKDYSNSGFDKGHMCPSADRTASFSLNSETFFLSNMVPQSPKNNEVTWEHLEAYLRKQVNDSNKEVYIIAGPNGVGGTGRNGGVTKFLANGRISVPKSTWKIAVVIPDGNGDLKRITKDAQVIAVDIPNNQNVDPDWTKYIVTVNDIETKTGYKFFSNVSSSVSKALKAKKYTN